MKKFLASLLATIMVLTTMSACVIPVSAEDAGNGFIFNENFENYATGENWIDKIDENGFVSGVENMDDEAWTIYGYDFNTTTDGVTNKGLVEIVADPSEAQIVIVNTCAFIQPAQQEAIDNIFDMADSFITKWGKSNRNTVRR